ncbi:MAG: sugar nucleotide-binding protein [Pirellulales bacterium]
MERLLVTGVDGPLGSNLALSLCEPCEVLGLYTNHAVELSGMRTAACSWDDAARLAELARDWQPRWIIDCGPLSASAWDPPADAARCHQEPQRVARLAGLADDLAARLTVISSDVVFGGPRMFHDESSPAGGTSAGAEHVLAMEQALAATRALVVRTHAYGWSPVEAHAGFAERAIAAVLSGRAPDMDGCRHATPLLATDLASYLLRAYALRLEGVYHVAGAERTSPFHFVLELAAALGLHMNSDRSPRAYAEAASDEHETSLSSKRARRMLEMTMPMLRDGLARFAAQRHNGWRERARNLGPLAGAMELAA